MKVQEIKKSSFVAMWTKRYSRYICIYVYKRSYDLATRDEAGKKEVAYLYGVDEAL